MLFPLGEREDVIQQHGAHGAHHLSLLASPVVAITSAQTCFSAITTCTAPQTFSPTGHKQP